MKANRYIHLLLCACVCICTRSLAQGVCASSALAPVYSQTFGTSASSTTKKDSTGFGISTKYVFHSSNLEDGEYMITPRVQNAGKSDWARGGDHTGNTNGNMYLINAGRPASGPVDLFFSTQVNNLCPGSVYSFSAWLVNVNTTSLTVPICGPFGASGTIPAKVKFNIKNTSGVILQTYTTPDLPLTSNTSVAPNWQQYGFQFTLPAGTTSLILEMRDALGGLASYCGNDFAVDDILFSACTPTATVTLSSASTICSGSSTSINSSLVNSPFSNPAYQWQKSTNAGVSWSNIGTPGTGAANYGISNAVVADGAEYRVIVGPDVASLSSSSCVTASNSITLTVNPSPAVTINSASPICSGNALSLTSVVTSGTASFTYSWSGPSGYTSAVANPTIANAPTSAGGTYSLTVTDSKGCTSNNTKNVTVNTTPVVPAITGSNGGCIGSTVALGNLTPGGIWSSSTPSVATVNTSGTVSILSAGSSVVSYTLSSSGCAATASFTITAAGITMHPNVIECNNGITHFDANDPYYGITYSNSNPGNTYSWNISGGPFSFQGSSTATSQYPGVQLQTGYSYTAIAQFTTNGITCSDTQMVFKNVVAADTIVSPHDTTVCYNTAPIQLVGKVSPVTNLYAWSTTGSGTFSNPNSLNSTYTLSNGDKAGGVFKIYLTASSTFNATGNCGTSVAVDSMLLSVYPNNTGTNSTQTICSNQSLNFTPVSAIPGSVYSWISSVSAGSATGNTASGTGNIIDSLVNLSSVNDAVVLYTITPYAFTPSNNTCTGTPFTFTVTAKPKPAVSITNNATAICTGSATNIQFSSSIPGSVYTWSSAAVAGTITGNSSNAVPGMITAINDVLTNNSVSNLTERYRITATSPLGCSRTDSTDVLVYGKPTLSDAGTDQALCNVTSALLSANNPVLGTGSWSMISGPSTVSFGALSNANSSVNNLVAGTYQLCWTISNGSCLASKDTVVLVNAPTTVAGTVSANATVCAGVNSGTLSVTGYTGSIVRWESSVDGGNTWPNIINNTTNTFTYNNLTATTYYRAVVQSGGCNAANANPASITVDPATVAGTLSAGVSVCAASNSGTLSISGYTGNIVRWESSTDGGNTWPTGIANTTNSYNYTNLTVTTLFRVVIKSGNCSAVTSNAVTITVNPQTVPGTLAASATVCATANSGTLTLTGYTNTVVRWESSIDNGSTWSNIANTTNSIAYTNLNATTQYRVSVQSGVCAPQYSNVNTITVLQPVTISNAGVDQTLCSTTSATLNGNIPTSGTGTWTAVAGNPSAVSFTNATDHATTVNGLITGSYQFEWTISNGLCVDSKDIVVINVNPQTVPGTLAASATVCATANSGTLTLTGYTNTVVRWESSIDNGSTWNNIANTTNSIAYTNLNATTQYRVSVQSGVCAPQYSNVNTITVLQPVTIANAGVDQTLCSTTSATLNGNIPTSGTGTWTAVAGNPSAVSFTNATDHATTVNGLTTGSYQFEWTISNGLCVDSKDIVVINVNPQTVPGTLAASATVCATANSGTLTLTGYTNTVVRWESSIDNGSTWSNIANTTNSIAYTNLNATTQYRVSVQSGVCAPQYSNVNTITVLQPVTIANAGVDQTLCSTTSATLNGNIPASGTGTWTAVAGNPSAVSFTNATDHATTVNGLITGSYQFEWTISNGLCADSKDIVVINVNPQTVPGTLAASATVCATANSGTLTLTGYTNTVVRWESSIDNGSTWSNIANTTNSIAYNNLSTTTQYRVSVQSGVCAPQYSNVNTITVLQPVTIANAGVDQTLCSTTSATLNGNIPTSGTGTWTAVAGNPSAVSFTNATDHATTVNGLTTGSYQFEWTVSNGLCADSKDIVVINVNPQTVPGTLAASATVCATANSGTLTLTGYTNSVVRWESSIDNGSTWNNIANTNNSIAYTNLNATTQYRVSVQSGVCAPQYSNVNTITVLQPVTIANAGVDQTLCSTTSATLNGNIPNSGTGTWTAVAGNPSAVSFTNATDHATTVNGLITGSYQFEWTISNGLCADSKDIVVINVNPQTVPGTLAASATVCATANSGTLTLTGYTNSVVRWESSLDNGSTWSNIANTTNSIAYTNLNATTQYRVSVQSGVCAPQYSNVNTITVLQPVTIANAGVDQTLCSTTSATLNGNIPASGTGTWTAVAGNPSAVSFTNATDHATTVNGLTTGSYQFEWTISNGLCVDSKDIVVINVNPQTVPGTLAASATVCATANSGTLTLTGYTNTVVRWESSIDNGSTWNNIANTTNSIAYTNLNATTQYRVSVQSGVCAPQYSNVNTITVLQPVTIANAGADQALCNVTTTQLNANAPTSGTGTWVFLSGPSAVTFTNATNPTTTINGLTTGVYQLAWRITNGSCAGSQDLVQLTVYSATVPGTLAADATVCATANTGSLTVTGYSSSILNWQSSTDNGTTWNNIANTTNTLNYTNLAGSTKYRASVQNAVCPALYSNIVTVNVFQAVSIADAGADIIVINGISSTPLNAVVPASGIGTWTQISGPTTISFSNKNDPKATVGGLAFIAGTPPADGIYQLRWTVANGVCAESEDIVQITVQPPTNPGKIGPDAVVCTSNNHGTLLLEDYTGTILQWELSTDYGANWNIIAATVGTNQATYDYNNLTTTTLFRALVQNGVGLQLYSGIAATITVLQLVTPSNAGTDQSLCNSTTATLAGNMPTSGTGTWTQVSGPSTATFSNATDPASIVNGLAVGTYEFAWTISNGICSDSKDFVQVIVYPPTIPGTLTAAATVCATANAATLSLTGYVSSVLKWESSADGTTWNNIANTSDSYAYTNLTATTSFRAYVQNAVCPALYSNIVTINVVQAVTPADAGTDQSLCNVTTATLAANTPTSGTGSWSFVSGPSAVTFTNANDPATTINGLSAGTYQFIWTISNAVCSPSQDIVQIIVYPPTIAGTLASAATVCATANAGTLSLTGFVNSVLRWESSLDGTTWNNIANTSGTLSYTNLTASTSYRTYVQNAICPALYSNAVTINVVQAVTPANAGTDQALCNVTSAALAANTPTSGTGIWTADPSNPTAVTFTNANDPATTINGLSAGTYQFVWTISNAVCSPSQDIVQIIVYPPTIAGTLASAATVCATANAGTLSLTGFVSSVLRWESSLDGTTWNNIANTSGTLSYTNLTASTSYRTYVQNAICPALYSNAVTINVVQAVTPANAGTDQALCNVTSAALAANTPTSGTGIWTADPSNPTAVTFTNANDPATTINGLSAGTYQFVWTISNAVCSPSQDIVQIIVYPPTIAGTLASAATVCATANAGTLSLTGFVSSVLRWESSLDGTTWNNIANTTGTLAYTNLTASTSYRTYVQNAICPALYSNAVTIHVVQAVTPANAGTDQALCNVTSAALAANTPTSGTGIWTADPSNPTTVTFTNANDPATTINGLSAGTYQFVWTISNAVCSPSQDIVQIIVYPPTIAGTLASAATVCATANAGTLSLTGFVSSVLRWESSLDGTTWNNIANTTGTLAYTNLTATTSYRTYVQNAICPALYSNAVTINVVQAVTPANAGTDQALCNVTSAALAANTPTSGTGIWTADPSNPTAVTFTNANDPATTINGLSAGTYQFVWTISNAVCSPSQDIVQIIVYPPTIAGTLASAATVCATANAGTLSLTGFVSSVLRWESSLDGTTWNNIANTTGTLAYTNLTATTSYRTYVQNAICPALYSNAVTINVVQAVTPANAGTDQALCNVTSAALAANTPTSGTGIWTADPSNPTAVTFTNANDPVTTINGLSAGTYQFVWTISNAVCSPSQDIVQIIVYPPTIAGTLASAATVCATANAGTLSLTGFVSSVLRWESSLDGTTWNNIANTTGTLAYTNLTATTSYRTYVQNAICPALYSNAVTINVVQAVTPANAGTDQGLCNVTSAALAANTPTSGTGIWTADPSNPTAVTFTNANDPATTINGLSAGTYQFIWTISNAVCSESKDIVQLIVYPSSVAGKLVADNFVCIAGNNGTVKLSGSTGKVLLWESSKDSTTGWNTIANTTDSLLYTNILSTTYYRASIQSGNCNVVQTNIVTIHVNPVSVGGKLTPLRDTICATANSGSLQLNGFTGVIMRWEFSTDKGNNWSVVNSSDSIYQYTDLSTSTWYRVLIQSGVCSSNYSDTAIITVDKATVTGILADNAVVCATSNTGKISVTGKTGAVIHWEVSANAGSSWAIITDTADSIVYANLSATTQYRALIRNGVCASLYSNTVTITVIQPVTIANAGADQVLCNANATVTLQANTPSSGNGKWSFVSGPSTISFTNPALPQTIASGLKTGTYRFVWTISNGTCVSSTDTVVIKNDRVVPGFTVASINDCGKTTFYYTNTTQSAFGIQNWKWFSNSGDTVTTKDNSLGFTAEGSKKITLAVQSVTGCTDTISALHDVIVYQFPKVNINAVTDICKTQLLQASPDINSQDSIAFMLWNLGNGQRAKDAMIVIQYMEDGNYTLKLTVATVNRCFDSAYKQISVHPIPDISISSNPIVCRGDSTMLTASGAKNYIWTDQNNNIICDGCRTTRVKPSYNTQYKVVGYSEYGCSQVKTTEVRVIAPLKMLATIGDTLCIGQSKQLFASGAATYSWYPATGLSNKDISSPIANPQTTTTYHVVGKDAFNCFVDTAEVKVAVGVPTKINIGKDTVITAGSVYQFHPQATAQDIRKWIWKSPVELSCRNCPSPEARISNDVDITVTAVNMYGCVSTDTISIKTFCGATELFVPNAFSPDGDGINDVLLLQGKGVKMIRSFKIFSRWGELVFEKSNFLPGDRTAAWDGKVRGNPASPDVFVYIAEVICEKGLPSSFKGNVAILK